MKKPLLARKRRSCDEVCPLHSPGARLFCTVRHTEDEIERGGLTHRRGDVTWYELPRERHSAACVIIRTPAFDVEREGNRITRLVIDDDISLRDAKRLLQALDCVVNWTPLRARRT